MGKASHTWIAVVPYPPLARFPFPDGEGEEEEVFIMDDARCVARKKPLPFGKGPPAGRGIGRRLNRQWFSTGGTDYEMGMACFPRFFDSVLIILAVNFQTYNISLRSE